MAEGFDPYHIWLAIPPEDQPPHHYRLLGVKPFEANVDVLESAADQRMVHVRSFQAGKHAAESQKLLNELSAARLCLLSADKRQAYDKALRGKLAAEKPPAAPPPPAAVARPLAKAQPLKAAVAAPAAQAASPLGFDPLEQATARRGSKKRVASTSPAIYAVMGVGLLAAVAVAWIAIGGSGTDDRPVAAHNVPTPPKPADFGSAQNDEPSAVQPTTAPPKRKGKPAAADDEAESESSSAEEDLPGSTEPSDDESDEMAVAGADEAGATETPTVERAEPPSADQLAAAVSEIQRVLRDDYGAAKKPAEKAALAEKLFALVAESSEASERFALLAEARRLANLAGSPTLAFQAADAQAESFAVDRFELLAKTADELAARELSSTARKELVEAIEPLVDASLASGQFASGRRLAAVGVSAARKANMPDAVKTLARQGKELAAGEKLAASAAEARNQLEQNPDDPKANETLGKYLCLYAADWPSGLAHLARAEDPALRAIAELESSADSSPGAVVKLGDAWWDLAERGGADADRMRARAGHWYEQVADSLKGLTKTRVDKRLAEVPTSAARANLPDKSGTKSPVAIAPSRRSTPKIGQWFDLLAITDPARQNRDDLWHRTDAGILADKGKYYPLQLPVEVDGNYDLHFEFTSIGETGTNIAFPAGSGRSSLAVGCVTGDIAGLDPFDGRYVAENATTFHHKRFEAGAAHAVDISVRSRDPQTAAITAKLDGTQVVQWQGNVSSLGVFDYWNAVPARAIGLNAWTQMVFHVARLKLQSGTATVNKELAASLPSPVAAAAKGIDKPLPPGTGAKAEVATPTVTADKIVLWNTRGGHWADRGTTDCHIELRKGGKAVWSQRDVKVAWSGDSEPATEIAIPRVPFDTLHIDIVGWHQWGGGLCEIEVLKGRKNLALGKPAKANGAVGGSTADMVVDGVKTSDNDKSGYWLTPDHHPGWVEVQLAPPATLPGTSVYLSDLPPLEAQLHHEAPLTFASVVGGKTYPHALYMHALHDSSSHVAFAIDRKSQTLTGAAAICDTAGAGLAVPLTFRIVGDGKVLWQTTLQKGGTTKPLKVRVDRVSKLELFVDCPGSANSGHAAWLDMELTPVSAAPSSGKISAPKPSAEDTGNQTREASGGVIADKLVVWNCSNNGHKNHGMLSCNVVLCKAGKTVWAKKAVPLAWSQSEEPATAIPLPKTIFDTVRLETVTFQRDGPALCEIEVFRGGTNLARGKPVTASGTFNSTDYPITAVVDGIKNSAQKFQGYWVAPAEQLAWIEVQVAPPTSVRSKGVYLSDLPPAESQIHFAFPLTHPSPVGGVTSPHSLFMHARENSSSQVTFELGKKYQTLSGTAAISDTAGSGSTSPLTFRIVGDGKELWRATMQKPGATQPLNVRVSRLHKLELFVDCPGVESYGHAMWIDMELTPVGAATK